MRASLPNVKRRNRGVVPSPNCEFASFKMGWLTYISENKWLWVAAAVAVFSAGKIRQYYRLRKFGGPFSTGISEFWHIRALFSWKPHDKYKEVCDKYGTKILRFRFPDSSNPL